MFWSRNRRESRRQQVLDELLALDPNERRGRLDVAVVAGDVRADEVESALRLIGRLDALRVMTVPPSGRLPGGIAPIGERALAHAEAANAANEAGDREGEADASEPQANATSQVRARSGGARASLATRSGRRSSRRRRRARIAADVPVMAEIEAAPEAAESWPSIEWLRP